MRGQRLRSWIAKFGHAFRGCRFAVASQGSLWVHVPMAVAVLVLGLLLGVSWLAYCILILCVAVVIMAELLNTAIEILAARLHPQHDEAIGRALDVAAAAVLVVAVGAAVVGVIILGGAAWQQLVVEL
ncbi:diacylglycerol kinase [Planctomycetaceae bacterium SH139]